MPEAGALDFEDLSNRVQALQRETEEQRLELKRLRLSIDGATDHAFILLDPENYIVSWNLGAERILGYKQEEILGKSGNIFFTPEDAASGRMETEMQTARQNGRADDERWHLRKDGTRFWGSGVMTPLFDDNHQLLGFCKIMRDLTERKQAADHLRQSEEHFRMLVEAVTDCALFQVDLDGKISSWNSGASRIFQYGTEEAIGLPFSNLLLEGGQELRPGVQGRILVPEEHIEDEGWLVRKDGTRLFGRWVGNPLHSVTGELQGIVTVLRDETARKLEEDLAEHQQKLERDYLQLEVETTHRALDNTKEELRALAANLMSVQEEEWRRIARELHDDLAQRLAMIEVSASRLRQSVAEDPEGAKAELLRIERQTAVLSNNVRDLSHQLHPAILDDLGLTAALESLAEEFQASGGQDVIFEAERVPDSIPPSVAAAFYRIAQEALRNVSKHAPGAEVRISIGAADGGLKLTISDSGPGFGGETKRHGGLGIISMKERTQLLGGQLTITSPPGQGTTVTVVAPLPKTGGPA